MPNPPTPLDARTLARVRHLAHMTITALSDALGVRPDTIRQWEKGRAQIPLGVVGDLVEVLEARVDDLETALDILHVPGPIEGIDAEE